MEIKVGMKFLTKYSSYKYEILSIEEKLIEDTNKHVKYVYPNGFTAKIKLDQFKTFIRIGMFTLTD